jgi:hypothetical protein
MGVLSKPLDAMTYSELDELRSIVNSNKFHERQRILWKEHSDELNLLLEKSRNARLSVEEKFRTLTLPILLQYAKEYIKVEDIIKFEGASRGGVRKVLSVSEHGTLGQVVFSWKKGTPVLDSYTSENPFSKLMGVYKENLDNTTSPDGLKRWFDRKDIVKFIKSKQS